MTNVQNILCIGDEVNIQKVISYDLGQTSLGLTIVKHTVHNHKGSLNLRSKINQGSTFFIKIPPASVINESKIKRKSLYSFNKACFNALTLGSVIN